MNKVLHWLPTAAVAAVVAAGVAAVPAIAGSDSGLPDKSAEEVLALIAGSGDTAFSGTVEQASELGLPELPTTGPGSSPGSPESSLVELLTASHTAEVYSDGADGQRLQVLDRLAERNVVRNGSDVWLYDSDENEATHLTLPAHDADADHIPGTPAELAQRFLEHLDPSTEVTVESGDRVAGRAVYDLVLTPRTDETLIGDVTVSVDAETGLPLQVAVDPRGQEQDAFRVGFTDVDFTAPNPDVFAFTPPDDATVHEGNPSDYAGLSSPMGQPLVRGSGWGTVVELPADVLGMADYEQRALLDQLTTSVPEGRALETTLVSVLLTTDGRALAGAVPLEALQAAAQ
jgi:outer membrane lipoprotein-sorting protein